MAECLLDKYASKELEKIQLLNNTVHRGIQDLSDDIEYQLAAQLKLCNGFSLEIDRRTWTGNAVRY
jgi:hypothetical protein